MKVRQRVFPGSRNRYIVFIRYETSKVKYIVLEDITGRMWVQEKKVVN